MEGKERSGLVQLCWLVGLIGFMTAWQLFEVEEMFTRVLTKKELKERYDYIIVGAGTAGAVLASRLAEDDDKDVLLIEAGGDPLNDHNINVPAFADIVRGTEFDWNYRTVPQKFACKGHVDNVSVWPSGRGLGGSSNINYMQYTRGNRHDYDGWVNGGAHGWGYKDVLPYFIKSEDQRNSEFILTVFHGFGGRLTVSDVASSTVNKIMELVFKEIGLKKRDLNGHNQFGWSPTQATIRNGVRWSTYRAFLRRSREAPNLHILTHAVAQKIIFEGRQATGVIIRHEGEDKLVHANKEIIISAGTMGTTKLLLLSGVGPRKHLQDIKIPVVADLPVGENLQDHVIGDGVDFFTPYPGVSYTVAKSENFASSWSYSLFGTGMKTSPCFRESIANIKLRHQPPHIKYPLLALHIVSNPESYYANQLNIKDEVWDAIHSSPPSREGFTIYPVLLHPKSRGTIRLKSSDPEEDILIDPKYLAEDVDVKILAEGYQFARRLVNAKIMKEWEFRLTNRRLPQCERFGNFTEQYIHCHLRHITLPGHSPVGTCRMGASGDPSAVVDPLLRVRGVKNLRVADASVIPSAMSGDTYATQVMIAEKAADLIREKDSVKPIKDYFKHLLAVKHKKFVEEEDGQTTVTTATEAGN